MVQITNCDLVSRFFYFVPEVALIQGGYFSGRYENYSATKRRRSGFENGKLLGSDGYRFVNVAMCDSPEVFYPSLGEAQIGEPVIIRRDLEKDED